jgi:lipopolysaccharide biosynthesis glycosyltransferase
MSNVVYTINKQYFNLFRVSCQSLINNSSIALDIYVLTKYNEFSIEEQKKISQYFSSQRNNVKLIFITSDLFEKYNDEGRLYKSLWFGDTVFLRLFIHDSLDKNWVTVLDADTIIVNNIDDLLTREYPMPIAGTLDLNYTKDTDYPYFCSAVYKVSLDYWRNKNINSKVLELLKEEYPFPEQDIMNRIFLYDKTILPMKYCMQNFYGNLGQVSALNFPSIVHFAGPDKPTTNGYAMTTKWDVVWYELESKTRKLKEELSF